MKPIELYDILTLDDNIEYVVANMVLKDNIEYLYLIEIDGEENPVDSNQKIVKRVFKDGDEAVEELEGEEQKEIGQLFYDLFQDMIEGAVQKLNK